MDVDERWIFVVAMIQSSCPAQMVHDILLQNSQRVNGPLLVTLFPITEHNIIRMLQDIELPLFLLVHLASYINSLEKDLVCQTLGTQSYASLATLKAHGQLNELLIFYFYKFVSTCSCMTEQINEYRGVVSKYRKPHNKLSSSEANTG